MRTAVLEGVTFLESREFEDELVWMSRPYLGHPEPKRRQGGSPPGGDIGSGPEISPSAPSRRLQSPRTFWRSLIGRGAMDIHKPKPWHGWRELVKEVGTIVIGVLIALGAEQTVEWLHWRHEVESERSALLDEAKANLAAVNYRVEEDACITRRLGEVEESFRRQAKGQPMGFRKPVGKPPPWVATTGSWDIALSGQALAHMSHTEKLGFSDAFDAYKHFALLRNEEDGIWRRLGLMNHPDILGASDWAELHQAFGEALEMNNRMKTLTKYILDSAALRQRPELPQGDDLAGLQAFCTSLF